MRPAEAACGTTAAIPSLRSSTTSPSSATTQARPSTPAASAVRAWAASMRNSPCTGTNDRGRTRSIIMRCSAEKADLAPELLRSADHALHAVDVGAEHRHHDPRPRQGPGEDARERLADLALGDAGPLALRVGGIGEQAGHPLLAQLCEPAHVE